MIKFYIMVSEPGRVPRRYESAAMALPSVGDEIQIRKGIFKVVAVKWRLPDLHEYSEAYGWPYLEVEEIPEPLEEDV